MKTSFSFLLMLCSAAGAFAGGLRKKRSGGITNSPPTRSRKLVQEQSSDLPFLEANHMIVMEFESIPINAPWQYESSTAGYLGTGYYRFDGNTVNGGDPLGFLNFHFTITNPGKYRMSIRSLKDNIETTWSNDCFTKLVGFEGYQGDWVKTYQQGGSDEWLFATQHDYKVMVDGVEREFKPIPRYEFTEPGTYTLQVAGRSKNFYLDRIVLFDEDFVQVSDAHDLSLLESDRLTPIPSKVEQLILIKANTDETLLELTEGVIIDLANFNHGLSVDAVVSGTVSTVEFQYGGTVWEEAIAPYAMAGNIENAYLAVPYLATTGAKTLKVVSTTYGTIEDTVEINFTIIDSSTGTTSAPVASPTTPPTEDIEVMLFNADNGGNILEISDGNEINVAAYNHGLGVVVTYGSEQKQFTFNIVNTPVTPSVAPVPVPTNAPVAIPTEQPVVTEAPVAMTSAPVVSPTLSPVVLTAAPTVSVTPSPTIAPVATTEAPVASVATSAPVASPTSSPVSSPARTIHLADFSTSAQGFIYSDDMFKGTSQPDYASGVYDPTAGSANDGALVVYVGGVDSNNIDDMSGGWAFTFDLSSPTTVAIRFSYRLEQNANFESNEESEVLCSVDGQLFGLNGNEYITVLNGNGDGGSDNVVDYTTISLDIGQLDSGSHTVGIGAYQNRKTYFNELTTLLIDSVEITSVAPTASPTAAPTTLATTSPTMSPVTPQTTSAPISPTASPSTAPPTTSAPVTSSPTPAPGITSLLVDAGSPTDNLASSTTGPVRVDSTTNSISNTAGYDEAIFQNGRSADGEFTYTIGGFESGVTAQITLGFAELWNGACGAGTRVQNVLVNGETFLTEFDIGATVGCFTATFQQRQFNSNQNGEFVIQFVGVAQNPLVNLIDITTELSPTAAPVTAAPTAAEAKWITVDPNAPIVQRHEACFLMVGQKAYAVGGRETKEVDIYNPTTRTWSKGTEAPELLHHMQCVAAQGKLFIMAAWTGWYPREQNAGSAYVYDPEDGPGGSWTALPALPENRRRGSTAVMVNPEETLIYVSHGNSGGHEVADDNVDAESLPYLDVYDIASQTWTELSSSAPNPRDHTGGFMKNGKLYVTGGRNGGLEGWPEVAATDVYDISSGQWSTAAAIPNPRSGANYGVTCDGDLMIAGGERGSAGLWDTVSIFDGSSWTEIASLKEGRHGVGLAFDCMCDQIHIASGSGGQGGGPLLNSVETYFPSGSDPGVGACAI